MSRRPDADHDTRKMRGDRHRHVGFQTAPIILDSERDAGIVYAHALHRALTRNRLRRQ